MSNKSKEKREELLSFLTKIKNNHHDDDSLMAINEIISELLGKKYGLVWEEHTERVDQEIIDKIPVFTEKRNKMISFSDKSKFNFLLEGDNLHSLYLLEKTHRGKVDVIYIDPPYNTGKKDFKYDDNYVDEEDGFKHSKWLSFMYTRLKVARNILSDNGIIFLSIDDNEQAQLKLLCDGVFGENSFVITMPRQTKKSGKTTGSFSKNHDYVLVYTKNNSDVFQMQEHYDENYKYEDEFVEKRGKYKLNQTLDYDSLSYSPSLDYPLEVEGEIFYPGGDYEKFLDRHDGNYRRADWAWRWNKNLFDFGYENGFIVIKRKKDGSSRIYTKTYLNAKINKDKFGNYYVDYVRKTKAMSSIELTENVYSNDRAKKDLAMFGLQDDFEYTKPVELIKTLIQCHKNKNATILDFFAGSGTTAQAVLLANIEDGGNRNFILCTNNENGICENVTYKRIHDTIKSYTIKTEKSEVLFEKTFNEKLLKTASSVLKDIDDVKKRNKDRYDRIKVSYKDSKIMIYGITKILIKEGIPANLKYFKTDHVDKFDDQEKIISSELMNHISEMVELENGIDLSTDFYHLVLSEEQLETLMLDEKNLIISKKIYIASDILLTSSQEKRLRSLKIEMNIIPDYYFLRELKEVGEV